MKEIEKMLHQEWYDSGEKEIVKLRDHAKNLCFAYNALSPQDKKERKAILSKLILNLPKDNEILSPFYCDYGFNIKLGEQFFANHNVYIMDCAKVTFGDRVFIGPNCGFYTAIHPLDKDKRAKRLEKAKPIHVGNDVWLGANVSVLPGVSIGDGVVVGAGSVVNKDLPSNVVAVGNPCRIVRDL